MANVEIITLEEYELDILNKKIQKIYDTLKEDLQYRRVNEYSAEIVIVSVYYNVNDKKHIAVLKKTNC